MFIYWLNDRSSFSAISVIFSMISGSKVILTFDFFGFIVLSLHILQYSIMYDSILLSRIKYDKVVLHNGEDIILEGVREMKEFEQIMEKMRERGVIPRIHYELMAIRVLGAVVVVLIGVGIVWVMVK